MTIDYAATPGDRICAVSFDGEDLTIALADGRSITVPLAWYPRLMRGTVEQRKNWQISGGGFGIHWPVLDEDLSSAGLLRHAPATNRNRPQMSSF